MQNATFKEWSARSTLVTVHHYDVTRTVTRVHVYVCVSATDNGLFQ
jgi:hypothetical protein